VLGVVSGGVLSFLSLKLFLALLCHFAWFASFRAICWRYSFSFF
jgi:hypothetical protein